MPDFVLSRQGVYHSQALAVFADLEHGFGTRTSTNLPLPVVRLKQVHGDACCVASSAEAAIQEGDALFTRELGLLISIRTADCIPILLFDPVRKAAAAIHAGWRGTASRISAKVVARLVDECGSNPADLIAAIGPGIGPCCFEVGEEVSSHFPGFTLRDRSKSHVDLWAANRRQLEEAGVTTISVAELCTCCHPEEFHSFRRDKSDGRMTSLIGIRKT